MTVQLHMNPWPAYFLTICFGVSSWVTINGLFANLPLIIDRLPEGWGIASTLGLTIQVANIGPLAYRLLRPDFHAIPCVVYAILAVGALSMTLLAFLWNVTIGGRSIMLIVFTFTAALCDCTSSLVYWPYVGAMAQPKLVAGLAIGESLSGVAASVVSWLGLSPEGSFCALAVVLLSSGAAFWRLQQAFPAAADRASNGDYEKLEEAEVGVVKAPLSPLMLYVVIGVVSAIENAVLPAILPYSSRRYSLQNYHVASTLPVGPCALFTLLYFQATRSRVVVMAVGAVVVMGLLAMGGMGYIDIGGGVTIASVLLVKLLLAYSKAASMYHLKIGAPGKTESQSHLETAGGMMQIWSLIGAVLTFYVVNFTEVFPKQY